AVGRRVRGYPDPGYLPNPGRGLPFLVDYGYRLVRVLMTGGSVFLADLPSPLPNRSADPLPTTSRLRSAKMSTVFTLDSMREALEKQYEPIKVQLSYGPEAVLQNLRRM